ncbi:MAG: hypothetical protein M3179_03315, partial [Actinomycetota bacterium]|nr:hypothetical protein [Actinomycetota bacterium]
VHALELVRGPAPTPPWEARGRDAEVERARQNTTRAIRATVERLGEMNAALGDHLRNRVRTGVHCSYVTDARAPVVWMVKDESDALDV